MSEDIGKQRPGGPRPVQPEVFGRRTFLCRMAEYATAGTLVLIGTTAFLADASALEKVSAHAPSRDNTLPSFELRAYRRGR